ncbi:hypothetical protein [Alkalisalibacterium limincola]|uniref:Lysozyme inhibitor n=1 Tax=Alkalisalibacterium limincola TaxID=2699169 RepID=A0A5C8KXD9_9GAMM|nr:hypothetical protein [Alkalisalibacterium limincola]TXK65068.1 hypothetical protein FU658_04585 [Alkalisalibacterium limincola]
MRWTWMLLSALATVHLAGCARDQSDTPTRPFTTEGVHFALTPSAARDCDPETVYEAVIGWRVQRPGRVRVDIRVDGAEGELFARSNEPEGSERTGPWVRRGMWFMLVDRDSGEVLAAQRAGPETCD